MECYIEDTMYSMDDYSQLGGRVVRKTQVEDHHDLMKMDTEMQLVSTEQFIDGLLCVVNEGRTHFEVAGESIKLMVSGKGKVTVRLGDTYITGAKRVAVYKLLMEQSGILDASKSGDWNIYVVMFNNTLYTIGFLDGNQNANFMNKYNEYFDEVNTKTYYEDLFRQRTKHSSDKTPAELHSSVYGDAVSGLGSIVEDKIVGDLDEAMAMIRAYKDTAQFQDIRDELMDILDYD